MMRGRKTIYGVTGRKMIYGPQKRWAFGNGTMMLPWRQKNGCEPGRKMAASCEPRLQEVVVLGSRVVVVVGSGSAR